MCCFFGRDPGRAGSTRGPVGAACRGGIHHRLSSPEECVGSGPEETRRNPGNDTELG